MINTTSEMTFRLNNLNEEQRRISYQSSTGKLLDNGSDDAKIFSREVYIEDKINVFEGLQRQVEKTTAQNNVSDSTMKEVKNVITYIKAEVIKGLNATSDDTSRESIATNLEGVKKNLFALANEEVEGEYLFAGADSTVKPFSMDSSGVVTYNGDGHLRRVAVEEGEYRDRGISGFDAMMYTTDRAFNGEQLTFSGDPTDPYRERIIDQDGNEWKLSITNSPSAGDGVLTKYDDENNATTDTLAVTQTAAATATTPAQYQTAALSTSGQVLEARHNIFDTIDRTINALRNRESDGSPAADAATARALLAAELDNITTAFDGANVGHAKLGGRNQVFETSLDRLGAKVTQFTLLQQEVSSADLAKVAIEAKSLEITYQALYSTVNKMNQLSLVNFVR